jgi:hypothetical protein
MPRGLSSETRSAHYTSVTIARAPAWVCGAIAQLGERLDRTQEVAGSSPASSTELVGAQTTGAPTR